AVGDRLVAGDADPAPEAPLGSLRGGAGLERPGERMGLAHKLLYLGGPRRRASLAQRPGGMEIRNTTNRGADRRHFAGSSGLSRVDSACLAWQTAPDPRGCGARSPA